MRVDIARAALNGALHVFEAESALHTHAVLSGDGNAARMAGRDYDRAYIGLQLAALGYDIAHALAAAHSRIDRALAAL